MAFFIFLYYSLFQNRDKLEKLKSQAEAFCQRLGRYRMPFAWATVNIMEVISQTAASDRDVTDSDSLKGGVYEFVHRRTCSCLESFPACGFGALPEDPDYVLF